MKHCFEITSIPRNFSKLASAAWLALEDQSLFEIDDKLIFTDCIEEYLNPTGDVHYCIQEFDSLAAFETWLLDCVSEWCLKSPEMLKAVEGHLTFKRPA